MKQAADQVCFTGGTADDNAQYFARDFVIYYKIISSYKEINFPADIYYKDSFHNTERRDNMNITIEGRQGYLQEISKNMNINFKREETGDPSLLPEASVVSPVSSVQKTDTFTKITDDPDVDDLSGINSIEDSLDFKIKAGMSREQLATHFGDLGRKLDEEYAVGKYTEEEYNDLDSQLMESYDSAITRCEKRAASGEVIKARGMERMSKIAEVKTYRHRDMTNIEKILEGMGVEVNVGKVSESTFVDLSELGDIIKELTESLKNGPDEDYNGEKMTKEQQHEADVKAQISALEHDIDEYADKYCATDRGAMAAMMNTVRQGGELLGGRDESLGQDKAMTWFVEGYQPVPDNIYDYLGLGG